MAKFNFFKDSKPLDKLEPSEIQQKIDDKKDSIEQIEADIKKSDESLVSVSNTLQDDVKQRKDDLEAMASQTESELEVLENKKLSVAEQRQTVLEQGVKANKKSVKKSSEIKAKHDQEKNSVKQKLEEKHEQIDREISEFKAEQDKQFIETRNELVEAVTKQKESLTAKKMKALNDQKQAIETLKKDIAQLEAQQLVEIEKLKEELAQELEKQNITKDALNQEVNNLKSKYQSTIALKKSEIDAKLVQWKNDFNQYAASNSEFLERKKAELTQLSEKEEALKETLRQKRKRFDVERGNLEKAHKAQLSELTVAYDELNRKINACQKDFEVESSLYEKEVSTFEETQNNEKSKLDELVATLAKELENYKNSITDESHQLENRFKADCDHIVEFYRDLLSKEKHKYESACRAIEEDIRRDEQTFFIDKKAIEEQKVLLENNYQETIASIKEKIVQLHEMKKESETSHQANILKLEQEFESNQASLEGTLQAKQQEYAVRKQEIEAEVQQANEAVRKQLSKLDQVNVEVAKQVTQVESALTQLKNDFTQVDREKKQELKDLEQKLVQLQTTFEEVQDQRRIEKMNYDNKMTEFTRVRAQLTQDHQAKIDEVKAAYEAKAKQVEEDFNARKKEFEAKHQADLEALKAESSLKIEELESHRAAVQLQAVKEKEIHETKLQQLNTELTTKIEAEKTNLQAETAKVEELRQQQASQIEQAKSKFETILSDLQAKIENQVQQFAQQETEYKQDILAKIHTSRDEVQRLKNEESALVKRISEIQDQFGNEKNELIKSTSQYLDQHLEKVSEYESLLTSKRSEVDATQASLNELISYYLECEEEEKAKLEQLEVVFAKEQQDQDKEIELSILKLENQKKGQLDSIRGRFEAERSRIMQQLEGEIQRHQQRIEEEKSSLLDAQIALDKEYADQCVSYDLLLEEIKKQVKQVQNESINEEKRFKSELVRLEKSHEFDREQLQSELELKYTNNNKYLEDIRVAFEQEQHEINLEKNRVANAIELKQKALDDKRIMFDEFFVKFNAEENARRADREQEIAQYTKNVTDLEQHIATLDRELEQIKNDNQAQLDSLLEQQRQAQQDYDTLIANRAETFNVAMERIKAEHEKEVMDYTSTCEAQQNELRQQNEAILLSYEKDFETFRDTLNKELETKQAEIASKTSQQEAKLAEEKATFEAMIEDLRAEEDRRVVQRNEEKARLRVQWDHAIQAIRDRITAAETSFVNEKEKLTKENQERVKAIHDEREELERIEQNLLLTSQELESAFEQKKREEDEKTRQYEEACYVQIADIDHIISQKNARVFAYRDEIKNEVLRAIEDRKNEEKRLDEMVLAKEQLLNEEREKIMSVIQKQQRMFEKLSAKKRAALDEEIARNNKALERELRRIESEKAKVGEDFSMNLDELDQVMLEKERKYEQLLASQKAKNEQYLQEYRQSLSQSQAVDAENESKELELIESLKQQLLVNEQEVLTSNQKNLGALNEEYNETIAKLQNNNNLVETRLNFLKEQVAQLTKAVESEEDSQKHKAFFTEFEQIIEERRESLKQLEEQENQLRHSKLEQLTEQNDVYNTMILEHQERVLSIENEIYAEQKRLTDFEEDISKRRLEQKEMEIKSRNLFTQKLDYLKQRMFDN